MLYSKNLILGSQKPGKDYLYRQNTRVTLYDPSQDKYCVANLKKTQSYVSLGGGIEEGDSLETTVRKELAEEAGYTDILIHLPLGKIHGYFNFEEVFYHREGNGFLVILKSPEKVPLQLTKKEVSRGFSTLWLSAREVLDKFTQQLEGGDEGIAYHLEFLKRGIYEINKMKVNGELAQICTENQIKITPEIKKPLIFATTNGHKIRCFEVSWKRQGLDSSGFECFTFKDLPQILEIPEVEETGQSFEKDAEDKAIEYAKFLKLPVIAQDRGFTFTEISWPGPDTKEVLAGDKYRVLGKKSTSPLNSEHFSKKQADFDRASKVWEKSLKLQDKSMFTTIVWALADPSGKILISERQDNPGRIANQIQDGIGYFFDWFFVPEGWDIPLSQMTDQQLWDYNVDIQWRITPKVVEYLKEVRD